MLAPSLVAMVLLGVGCGHRPPTVGTAPTDPATVVEQFMAAVKANDLPTMGRLWGTAKGPDAPALPGGQRDQRPTVVQAYRELEEAGVVESRQGAGTFVRELAEPKRDAERQREARRLVRHLIHEAASLGVTREDLEHALKVELKVRLG